MNDERRGYRFSGRQLLAVMDHVLPMLHDGKTAEAAALLATVVRDGERDRTYAGLRRYGIRRPTDRKCLASLPWACGVERASLSLQRAPKADLPEIHGTP